MSIPDMKALMLPTLKALANGSEASVKDIRECVAASEGHAPEDVREVLPSGRQTVLVNRVSWAINDMGHAGLLERTQRGVYRLLPEGKRLLSHTPSRIDLNLLREYPGYVKWRNERQDSSGEEAAPELPEDSTNTPEEALEKAARFLRESLETEVLERVHDATPALLEQVIVDLLIAMGYGGGDAAKRRVTGRSGDGGIDGTIQEDALGLDEVYVQAKKHTEGNTVGEGDLRDLAGAIDLAGTTKGVFVTTATVTRSAKDYGERSPKRIVLIDGAELARMVVRHGVGVRTRDHYEIKRIDEDNFDQEAW